MAYSVRLAGTLLLLAICAAAKPGYREHDRGYRGSPDHDCPCGADNLGDRHERRDERHEDDDTIYRFAVGGNYGPYEYLDENGRLKGFHLDLLHAVCAKAGKKCTSILDQFKHCWAGPSQNDPNMEYPGVGLLAGYYDACMGLVPTQERFNAFNFTISYAESKEVSLYYLKGAEGDLNDLTGKKIGFVSGWMYDQKCVARQSSLKGNQAGQYEARMFPSAEAVGKAVESGEIDATIFVDSHMEKQGYNHLVVTSEPPFTCSPRGEAVMARYSRMDLINWWNDAFEELRWSGDFKRLCEQSQKDHDHRGDINCAL